MPTLLCVDSSVRTVASLSRRVIAELKTAWMQTHPGADVIYRDLAAKPVPHITKAWTEAAYVPESKRTDEMKEALAVSDELVGEVLAADRYAFGVPMYNFTVPSLFKAYLDQIIRAGVTFSVNKGEFTGLLDNRKAAVVTARGGFYQAGGQHEEFDFQEPYLRAALGLIGIEDVTFIHLEGVGISEAHTQEALRRAREEVGKLMQHW